LNLKWWASNRRNVRYAHPRSSCTYRFARFYHWYYPQWVL